MHADVPCPTRHLLERFLLGRVPAAEAELLERHLNACVTCGTTLDELGAEDALVTTMRSRSPILAAWSMPSGVRGESRWPWNRPSRLNSVWPWRTR